MENSVGNNVLLTSADFLLIIILLGMLFLLALGSGVEKNAGKLDIFSVKWKSIKSYWYMIFKCTYFL